MSGPDNGRPGLPGYEEVPDRLRAFYADHPNGRVAARTQMAGGTYRMETDPDGQQWIVIVADAYRDAGDEHPAGTGTARDPYPGRTRFTAGSEAENVETSAWGRALAAAGYPGKSVASAEEIQAARAAHDARTLADPDAVRELLVAHIPKSQTANRDRLEAMKAAGLEYESVSAALKAMTVAELEALRGHLEPAEKAEKA